MKPSMSAPAPDIAEQPLLQVDGLQVHFPAPRPHLFAPKQVVHAVDGVSFTIARGRTLGLVGESGCGKSTTGLAVLRLARPSAGAVRFDGVDVTAADDASLRRLRPRMQMIFQDPYSSLNPRNCAAEIVREPLDINAIGTRAERAERVRELFHLVGLRPDQMPLFPHQFSGGQRQRIGIARALATGPELIVCDEPVSALDVAIQAQVVNLLVRLQEQFGLAYLFISHDLAVVRHLSDDVAVMYLGKVVEQGSREHIFTAPAHPYTRALLSAVPSRDPDARTSMVRTRLTGDLPSPMAPPAGCRFHTRCPLAIARCSVEEPMLVSHANGHRVACHLVPTV